MKKKHPHSTAIQKAASQRGPDQASLQGKSILRRLSHSPLAVAILGLLVISAAAGIIYGVPYLIPDVRPRRHVEATGADQDSDPAMRDKTTPKINDRTPPGPAPEGMVWVPGGWFWMGINLVDFEDAPVHYFLDASPMHKVYVSGFWMDKFEVTSEQFARFADATGYVTIAERQPDPQDFPGVPLEELKPFSIGFKKPTSRREFDLRKPDTLFDVVYGASWRRPDGPQSSISGREKYPAVHICYDDAVAYCKWAGKRLPTEAEWEFAARGGLDRKKFCWGDEHFPKGKALANWWQGDFPLTNDLTDGHAGVAPVGSYPANGYGLHDMAGNVWEWCADFYQPEYYKDCLAEGEVKDPRGHDSGFDPNEPGIPKRVQRGGSYRCADNYCMRYIPGARGKGEPTSASSHVGFRCVKSP